MLAVRILLLLVAGIGVQENAVLCLPVMEDKGAFKTLSPLPQEISSDNLINDDSFPKPYDLSKREQKLKKYQPLIRHPGVFDKKYNRSKIVKDFDAWKPESGSNIWELSGLFEGDIMMYPKDENRNGVLNESLRWEYGIVPYFIQEEDFSNKNQLVLEHTMCEEELEVINGAIDELQKKTCLKFRPQKNSDSDYIVVQGNRTGCWSYVGRRGGGQVLNLMTPGCVKHGVVIHEFNHALGFYHQQSSYNRDKYVTIHWDNIIEEHKHNFKKYDSDTVSNYKVGYDYNSLMHYGPRAFAKNINQDTITPKKENVVIGQRLGLSEKDVAKLKIMYEEECKAREFLENTIDLSLYLNA